MTGLHLYRGLRRAISSTASSAARLYAREIRRARRHSNDAFVTGYPPQRVHGRATRDVPPSAARRSLVRLGPRLKFNAAPNLL
jgi:hypothetical protein